MAASLFHIHADGTLSQMREAPYESERQLQKLLAEYPQVLGAEQYVGSEPRRWLLVSREMAVPDGEGKSGRWSLDHLYLDQDAIPTLVEVKRESDSRSRREVVGQMLDYAANGPSYWPLEDLKAAFVRTQERQGKGPEEVLLEFLGDGSDVEDYWNLVQTNLRAGRIRMIFLVDAMPPELLQIVRFLARHLREAEVYAVEVRHHSGPSGRLLATDVMGHEPAAEVETQVGKPKKVQPTEAEWIARFRERHGEEATQIVERLMPWMKERAHQVFTTDSQTPSFMMVVREGAKDRYPLFLTGNGKATVSLAYLASSPKFAREDQRRDVIHRMAEATGMDLSRKGLNDDIRVPITALTDESALQAYLSVVEFILERLKAAA